MKATSRRRGKMSPESVANWAESRTKNDTPAASVAAASAIVSAPRHPVGRGSEMTGDEIENVRLDYLVHRLTQVQLSEKYGRARNTIAKCLEGKTFEEMRRQIDADVREMVRRRMVAKADDAVGYWERSMGNAAERGDHKPAKDWLMHSGVVDPVESTESGPKVIVQIGVNADEVKVGISTQTVVHVGVQ
jgi:hypothetical protein